MYGRGKINLDDSLVRSYIGMAFTGDAQAMLLDSLAARRLVLAVDGIDEAAGIKTSVETSILKEAALRTRCIMTSR